MTIPEAKVQLVAQHAHVRELLRATEVAALRFLDEKETPTGFRGALASLRTALVEHNQAEEELLIPLFQQSKVIGPPPVALMLYEHVAEHAGLVHNLTGPDTEVAARVPRFSQELRKHMDLEERSFLYQAPVPGGAGSTP